jgi:hypothetical protein
MHSELDEWYRLAGIPCEAETLLKRWKGVEAYEPEASDIVNLTCLFYGLGKPQADFLAKFANVFEVVDGEFKSTNLNELAVLAGATLVDVIERGSFDDSVLATFSLVSCAASNMRGAPLVKQIPEIAARSMGQQSLIRHSADSSFFRAPQTKELIDALEMEAAPMPLLAKELRTIQRQAAVEQEESNILWWVFSGHSRDLGQRFSECSVGTVALLAGRELAELILMPPGPTSCAGLLDHVIKSAQTKTPKIISLQEAINSIPANWRKQFANIPLPANIRHLIPVTVGMMLSVEGSDTWTTRFTLETGIPAKREIVPYLLSYQTFIECMLIRIFRRSE